MPKWNFLGILIDLAELTHMYKISEWYVHNCRKQRHSSKVFGSSLVCLLCMHIHAWMLLEVAIAHVWSYSVWTLSKCSVFCFKKRLKFGGKNKMNFRNTMLPAWSLGHWSRLHVGQHWCLLQILDLRNMYTKYEQCRVHYVVPMLQVRQTDRVV